MNLNHGSNREDIFVRDSGDPVPGFHFPRRKIWRGKGLVLAAGLLGLGGGAWAGGRRPLSAPVSVDLYVMSQCPFGVQAEDAFLPAIRALGPAMDVRLRFIAREVSVDSQSPDAAAATAVVPSSTTNASGFSSLHGPAEVEENIRQLCVQELAPGRLWDYLEVRNPLIHSSEWSVAVEAVGLSTAQVAACVEGPQGKELLRENLKAQLRRQAPSSPTIDVNGILYEGKRSSRGLAQSVCEVLNQRGEKLPKICRRLETLSDEVPAVSGNCGATVGGSTTPVQVTVVVDERCPACQPSLVPNLRRFFPQGSVTLLDVSSPSAQALLSLSGLTTLPLYHFSPMLAEDGYFKDLEKDLVKVSSGYILRPEAGGIIPTVHLERPLEPGRVDFFVDSKSPDNPAFSTRLKTWLEADPRRLDRAHLWVVALSTTGKASALDAQWACAWERGDRASFFNGLISTETAPGFFQETSCPPGVDPLELLSRSMAAARQWRSLWVFPSVSWDNRYGPFYWNEVDWEAFDPTLSPRPVAAPGATPRSLQP